MDAIKNLLASEKGLLAILLIIAATVLACLGKMDMTAWREFVTWIFGIYVGGKTVQGAVQTLKDGVKKP